MIERAVSARVPFAWVAADEAYGDNGPLRTWLEQQHIAYVLAVARDHRVPAGAGRTVRADELAARLPRRAWQQLSAGDGAKGHRWYDWAWVTISNPGPGHRYLLIRRNRSTGEQARKNPPSIIGFRPKVDRIVIDLARLASSQNAISALGANVPDAKPEQGWSCNILAASDHRGWRFCRRDRAGGFILLTVGVGGWQWRSVRSHWLTSSAGT